MFCLFIDNSGGYSNSHDMTDTVLLVRCYVHTRLRKIPGACGGYPCKTPLLLPLFFCFQSILQYNRKRDGHTLAYCFTTLAVLIRFQKILHQIAYSRLHPLYSTRPNFQKILSAAYHAKKKTANMTVYVSILFYHVSGFN